MIFEQLHQIIFNQNKPISEVISCFNETAVFTDGKGFGIVINADGIAIGVITDGDIRRKLMEGVRLEEPVSNAMKQDFIYAKTDYTTHQILRYSMTKYHIGLLTFLWLMKSAVQWTYTDTQVSWLRHIRNRASSVPESQ